MENDVHKWRDPAASGRIQVKNEANQSSRLPRWFLERLMGPGALYNLGNLLALSAGIALALHEFWGQASLFTALRNHLIGSAESIWLTASMLLFIVAGDLYHRAGRKDARACLLYWGDFGSAIAAIFLTIALVKLGASGAALLAGAMLTIGKLGSGLLPLTPARNNARIDRLLRYAVVASRAPSLLSLTIPLAPALLGWDGYAIAPLSAIMIICFLLWLWADLLLLSRG